MAVESADNVDNNNEPTVVFEAATNLVALLQPQRPQQSPEPIACEVPGGVKVEAKLPAGVPGEPINSRRRFVGGLGPDHLRGECSLESDDGSLAHIVASSKLFAEYVRKSTRRGLRRPATLSAVQRRWFLGKLTPSAAINRMEEMKEKGGLVNSEEHSEMVGTAAILQAAYKPRQDDREGTVRLIHQGEQLATSGSCKSKQDRTKAINAAQCHVIVFKPPRRASSRDGTSSRNVDGKKTTVTTWLRRQEVAAETRYYVHTSVIDACNKLANGYAARQNALVSNRTAAAAANFPTVQMMTEVAMSTKRRSTTSGQHSNGNSWYLEEDRALIMLVQEHGYRWGMIARCMEETVPHGLFGCDNVLKDDKKCRERYLNHLDPTVNHGPWTDAEDCMLFLKQGELGNRWSAISKFMKGRTEKQCKNRWYASMRKAVRHKRMLDGQEQMSYHRAAVAAVDAVAKAAAADVAAAEPNRSDTSNHPSEAKGSPEVAAHHRRPLVVNTNSDVRPSPTSDLGVKHTVLQPKRHKSMAHENVNSATLIRRGHSRAKIHPTGAVAVLPYTDKDVRASDCSSPAGLSIKQVVNASPSGPPEPVELLASAAAVLVSRSGRQTKAPGVFDPSEASRLPQWGSSLARQGSFLDGLSPPSSPAGSLTNTDQMGYL